MTDLVHQPQPLGSTDREEHADSGPILGRWYWVREADDEKRWLGCVVRLGSNYAGVDGPFGGPSRVHLDHFAEVCHAEPDAERYIDQQVQKHYQKTRLLVAEVQAVAERLALSPQALTGGSETQALALRGSSQPTEAYKSALVKAKGEELPALFEAIERENKLMAQWSKARILPMQAQVAPMKEMMGAIEARVFSVELYAGLTENAAKIKDGKPAVANEPIRLFQRRHYMDEECLANYEAGGMSFRDVGAFDAWLAREDNFRRIFPFPRCIVAFRVRREKKEQEFTNWREFISFAFGNAGREDMKTFLYIRNGEQLHWLETEIDFGAKIFPDQDQSNLSGKLYADASGGRRPDKVITENEWLAMKASEAEAKKKARSKYAAELLTFRAEKRAYPAKLRAYGAAMRQFKTDTEAFEKAREEWQRAAWTEVPYDAAGRRDIERIRNKDVPDFTLERPREEPREPREPWRPHYYGASAASAAYTPFTKDNVFFDEIAAKIKADLDAHNRLVLVLQGLLDRSITLQPHPRWQLWEPSGFEAALRLVYDDSRALVPGPKPDFEAYKARCNAGTKSGVTTFGQERYWEEKEAEKLNARENLRSANHYDRKAYRPRGDPGPGKFARVVSIRGGKATFEWEVERTKERWEKSRSYRIPGRDGLWSHKNRVVERRAVKKRIAVPLDRLFNVDAYRPGDYQQFLADPRTRADYLEWAPMLLNAEDFKAGKIRREEE